MARTRPRPALLWKALAYAGRYGHQPLDGALRMTLRELDAFNEAVSNIVEEENKPGHG